MDNFLAQLVDSMAKAQIGTYFLQLQSPETTNLAFITFSSPLLQKLT